MPGNEFENKVQKRLEELNLSPSNAVWNHVEKEIRKDRRKRRLLFLLPLLLLLGIGGYWAMQPSSGSSIANSDKKIQNDTKNSVSDPAAVVVSPSGTPEQNSSGKDPVNQPDQKNTSGTAEDKASDVVIEQKTNNPILSNIDHDRSSINAPVKKKKNKVASASHSSVAKNK